MSDYRAFVRDIPQHVFAVLCDTEHKTIAAAGRYDEMVDLATAYNRVYQSTAYCPRLWIDRGEEA